VILLRGSVSLLGFLLLLVLAVVGLALAVFSIQTGDGTLSLATLADALRLSDLRDSVDGSLSDLESGAADLQALLIGLGVIALGVLLLLGVFVPSRERLVALGQGDGSWPRDAGHSPRWPAHWPNAGRASLRRRQR